MLYVLSRLAGLAHARESKHPKVLFSLPFLVAIVYHSKSVFHTFQYPMATMKER